MFKIGVVLIGLVLIIRVYWFGGTQYEYICYYISSGLVFYGIIKEGFMKNL